MVLTGCKNRELQYQHAKQDMFIGGMIIINMKITNHILIGFVVHYTEEIDASEQEKHATIDTDKLCMSVFIPVHLCYSQSWSEKHIFAVGKKLMQTVKICQNAEKK